MTSTPGTGATSVSPVDPITVRVSRGTISSIALVNADGYHVKGDLSTDRTTWHSSEALGYGKKYVLTGTARGTDGKSVPIHGDYTVLTPQTLARSTVYPVDGMTVGVAMPIEVKFLVTPQDRALIERHVSVTTTPKVDGAWAWIDHDGGVWGLDFRPEHYWPEYTKVHVQADLYGLKFADGAYGKQDITSDFTIGRNQVVYADAKTHVMTVKRDGQTVATYPASLGADAPDRQSRSGIHVVSDKQTNVWMTSQKFHYHELEHWAVRISDNGEFIHANPKTVASQGNTNVSHGCVNLSTDNAHAYYDSAIIGDPVEITGTDVELGAQDGDIFDWTVPWSEWLLLSALR